MAPHHARFGNWVGLLGIVLPGLSDMAISPAGAAIELRTLRTHGHPNQIQTPVARPFGSTVQPNGPSATAELTRSVIDPTVRTQRSSESRRTDAPPTNPRHQKGQFMTAPTRCRQCSALLARADEPCVRCAQYSQPTVPAKSVGLAMLLTVGWLGAGHLYANRVFAGALLLGLNLFLVLLSFTGAGLVLSVPLWCVAAGGAMVTAANAVQRHNERAVQPRPLAPF
jgi:TM2 domain-containing membrane protein YozV